MNVNPRIRIDPTTLPGLYRRLKAIRIQFAGTEVGAQREFALRSGILPSNWNTMEMGRGQRIGIDAAMKIAERWPVSLDYIFLGRTDALAPAIRLGLRRIERKLLKDG
jgi:transcriptional regulator with XRE-family HTH domain